MSASAAWQGIHRISLPTPWPVGDVNVYLIEGEPLTLIDTGPLWRPALDGLERSLRTLGHTVEALERIVVTHQHLDHAGQAGVLVRRSGAELCALAGLDEWLATYPASAETEDLLANRILRRHGASDDALEAVWTHNVDARSFGIPATVSHSLVDGDTLEFADRRLRVFHRPGHSPSDTVFYDEQRGVLLAGDVLLAHQKSSAVIAPPLDGSEVHVRPRAFVRYLESLRAIHEMDVGVMLPGHGAPIHDHRALIVERLERYDRTTGKVAALLSAHARTASELALALRGNIPAPVSFFVLCELLGHLDRLLDASIAVEFDHPGVKRFALA